MAFHFGKCPCGGGDYVPKEVDVKFNDQSLNLEGVLQGACETCGSRVYKLDTLRRIEAVMRKVHADPLAGGPRSGSRSG
jgi:hypothetical protein